MVHNFLGLPAPPSLSRENNIVAAITAIFVEPGFGYFFVFGFPDVGSGAGDNVVVIGFAPVLFINMLDLLLCFPDFGGRVQLGFHRSAVVGQRHGGA